MTYAVATANALFVGLGGKAAQTNKKDNYFPAAAERKNCLISFNFAAKLQNQTKKIVSSLCTVFFSGSVES